ncbi:hypothetical protein PAMP_016720 [Pampus punctatissimus]
MEHFRWGKPVGRKRRPVKVYTSNGVEEESAEVFPGEIRRRELANELVAAAEEEDEEKSREMMEEEQQQQLLQEKKDGSYKMKHFRWSGPPASKRYGGFMKSWDERSQRPLLTLFKNVINKDGQQQKNLTNNHVPMAFFSVSKARGPPVSTVMDPFIGSNPRETLERVSASLGCSPTSAEVAAYLDKHDDLRHLRQEFLVPKIADLPPSDLSLVDGTQECIYLVGNSLGLQPKKARKYLEEELEKWAKTGVHGHTEGSRPWAWAENNIEGLMADVVGAKTEEVALMNGLTVNLHLLMLSFYKPTAARHKILLEDNAFPSDHYAVESQIRLRGFNPDQSMLLLSPRAGEETLRTEDILEVIEKEGDSIAVVLFSGVQYYTGQLFNMAAITEAGHKKGCYVGFDCAHAAGNAELKLHDWGVDFACWCSYKVDGMVGTRPEDSVPDEERDGAAAWRERLQAVEPAHPAGLPAARQLSMTSMRTLRRKSLLLTGYLEYLIQHIYPEDPSHPCRSLVHIITPSDPQQRGCQLSLAFSVPIRKVFQELEKRGVACDMREPSVLRVAPVPLYNSFSDVHRFIETLGSCLAASSQ